MKTPGRWITLCCSCHPSQGHRESYKPMFVYLCRWSSFLSCRISWGLTSSSLRENHLLDLEKNIREILTPGKQWEMQWFKQNLSQRPVEKQPHHHAHYHFPYPHPGTGLAQMVCLSSECDEVRLVGAHPKEQVLSQRIWPQVFPCQVLDQARPPQQSQEPGGYGSRKRGSKGRAGHCPSYFFILTNEPQLLTLASAESPHKSSTWTILTHSLSGHSSDIGLDVIPWFYLFYWFLSHIFAVLRAYCWFHAKGLLLTCSGNHMGFWKSNLGHRHAKQIFHSTISQAPRCHEFWGSCKKSFSGHMFWNSDIILTPSSPT